MRPMTEFTNVRQLMDSTGLGRVRPFPQIRPKNVERNLQTGQWAVIPSIVLRLTSTSHFRSSHEYAIHAADPPAWPDTAL